MKYTLRMLRAMKNMSQREAAEAVGMKTNSPWSVLENFDAKQAQQIADLFGVKVEDIEFIDGLK